jgi:hypothetical protein
MISTVPVNNAIHHVPQALIKEEAMLLDAKIDEEAKTLTLVLKLQEPTPSASGKTLVVASTHGNVPAAVKIDGHDVIVGVNAYIRK